MDSSPANNNLSVSASSSPSIPTRPNPNKPRDSDTGDTMRRRSFLENPSPADSSRRNPISRECNRVECGDKENHNDKDQISNVTKAPKCAKNFMSPTISAVSKINPFPRKKRILSDKNKTHHQIRSSVSFSEEDKVHENVCIDERKKLEEESHSLKISPFSSHVSYAFPVDQSLIPYDPKKNYLSPRPQFLHYRPNPRIDHYFDEFKQLDELFVSESSSFETDLSAEENQQEEEEVASHEGIEEETQEKDGEENFEEAEEVVGGSIEEETHEITTKSRFKTWRLLGLIFLALWLLVSSTAFKDSTFNESAKESFDQLSVKLRMFAEPSLVFLDKLISSFRGEVEEQGYGLLQFYNLTDTLDGKRLSDTVFKPTSSSVSEWFMDSQEDLSLEIFGHQELQNSFGISLEAAYKENGNEMEQESQGGDVNYSEMVCEFDTQSEIIKMDIVREMKGGEQGCSEAGKCGQETDDVERHREYEENEQKYIEECLEYETRHAQEDEKKNMDTHQLVDVEFVAVSTHKQIETEVSNDETLSEEEEEGNVLEEESVFGEVLLSNEKKMIALLSTVMVLLLTAAAASFFLKAKMSYTKGRRKSSDDSVESMASSSDYSIDSVSYGSFTRYEKLQMRSGEEEIITPVRRSSRIKKQSTTTTTTTFRTIT
ncbi:unnamed protein product [Cochlearia groenlandica]